MSLKPDFVCEDCDFDARDGAEHTLEAMQAQWPVLKSPMWKMWLCQMCFTIRGCTLREQKKILAWRKKIVLDKWDNGIYTELDEKVAERKARPKDVY